MPWLKEGHAEEMDIEARATLAFFEVGPYFFDQLVLTLLLQVDKNLSSVDNTAETCGATASVVILQSLDAPSTPFFSAKEISLTVAHCG